MCSKCYYMNGVSNFLLGAMCTFVQASRQSRFIALVPCGKNNEGLAINRGVLNVISR